jgi:hypothetical protein
MNPNASLILDMPVRHAIGTRIKFRSHKTLRTRSGRIVRVSGNGVRVIGRKLVASFVPWDSILEILNPKTNA